MVFFPLSLWKARESESEAVFALSEAKIVPDEFGKKIGGMPSFRSRIIYDYLLNKVDEEKLFEALKDLDDFKKFLNNGFPKNNKTLES